MRRTLAAGLLLFVIATAGVADAGRFRLGGSRPPATTTPSNRPASPIPEPSAVVLFGVGSAIAVWAVRRRARS